MSSVSALYHEISVPAKLNPDSIRELNTQLETAEKQGKKFVVLRGNPPVFCNGLDLNWVVDRKDPADLSDISHYGEFLNKLLTGNFISIAVVSGIASGGGMGIICACDYVVADNTSEFSLPEGMLGLIPGIILPALLNRLTPQRVKKMVFTGKRYPAKKAKKWGIADKAVVPEDLEAALVEAINAMRSCKTESVSDLKQMLFFQHLSKKELGELGQNILESKLSDADVVEKLKDILYFMRSE
jgi:methylglutaconyl-CoA hydratase